jgi:hypothetical protein
MSNQFDPMVVFDFGCGAGCANDYDSMAYYGHLNSTTLIFMVLHCFLDGRKYVFLLRHSIGPYVWVRYPVDRKVVGGNRLREGAADRYYDYLQNINYLKQSTVTSGTNIKSIKNPTKFHKILHYNFLNW